MKTIFHLVITTIVSTASVQGSTNFFTEELSNASFTCDALFRNETTAVDDAKRWNYTSKFSNESSLLFLLDDCVSFKEHFFFPKEAATKEEANFSLAYSLIVYTNPEQVIRMLSAFYWPQNIYCISYDTKSSQIFQKIINKLPKCFPNIFVPEKLFKIDWGEYGALQAAMGCLKELIARNDSAWHYFQYLSGTSLPLKTNFEMVKIFKALNGSFNSEILSMYPEHGWRFNLKTMPPPGNLTIIKSSFSAAFSRKSAEVIVNNKISQEYFKWLDGTGLPEESYWSTIAGNSDVINMPGGFPAALWLNETMQPNADPSEHFIARYQVLPDHKDSRTCYGSLSHYSCVFGVEDLPVLRKRKELIAHKFDLDFQPATFFCLVEAIRKKTVSLSVDFDTEYYSNMPGPRYMRTKDKKNFQLHKYKTSMEY